MSHSLPKSVRKRAKTRGNHRQIFSILDTYIRESYIKGLLKKYIGHKLT